MSAGTQLNLDDWADAIAQYESGGKPNALNFRNNNPGNLRYAGQHGAVPGQGGFAAFPTMQQGREALKSQLARYMKEHPNRTLTQHMAHYLGNKDPENPEITEQGDPFKYAAFISSKMGYGPNDPLPPTQGTGGRVKPFNELAKDFDPLMPQEVYDQIKQQYFHQFVAPHVPHGFSVPETWKEFDKATQRAPLLSPEKQLELRLRSMQTGFWLGAVAPLDPGHTDPLIEQVKQFQADAIKLHQREGMSTVDIVLPEMAGAAGPLTLAGEGAEPIAADIASEFGSIIKSTEILHRALRGGVSFAAYEAAVANKEDRGVAALKGFALGAGLDGALGLGGKLLRRGITTPPEDALQEALTPGAQTDPVTDEAITQQILNDVKVAKKDGYPLEMKEDPSIKDTIVKVQKHDGSIVEESIYPGLEPMVVDHVQYYTQQGGQVLGITYHPERVGSVNKFLQLIESNNISKNEVRFVRTEPGQAPQVAGDLQLLGKAAEPAGSDTVHVSREKKPPSRDQIREVVDREGGEDQTNQNMVNTIRQLWDKRVPMKSRLLMRDRIGEVYSTRLNELLPDDMQVPEKIQGIYQNLFEQWIYQNKPQLANRFRLYNSSYELLFRDQASVEERFADLRELEEKLGTKLPKNLLPADMVAKSVEENAAAEAIGNFTPERPPVEVEPPIDYEEARSSKIQRLYNIVTQLGYGHGDTVERAEQIITSMGLDPAKIDIDDLGFAVNVQDLEKKIRTEEILQTAEQEIAEKSRDIVSPGAMEEAVRKGEIPKASARTPISERIKIALTPSGPRAVQISPNDSRIAIKTTPKMLEDIVPGSRALTVSPNSTDYVDTLNRLGITEISPHDPRPMFLYTEDGRMVESVTGRTYHSDVWHEGTHVNLFHMGGGKLQPIYTAWSALSDELITARQIAKYLKESPAYQGLPGWQLNEEAFVHAATAVRTGDAEYLAELAKVDRSVRHVLDMVANFADSALEVAKDRPDINPIRRAVRAFEYVKAKASREMRWEVNRLGDRVDGYGHYDPAIERWKFTTPDGKVTVFRSTADLFNHIDQLDGSTAAPSFTLPFEMRGARGIMAAPRGLEPTRNIPMPEHTPGKDQTWMGWKGVEGAFRPFLPWADSVHQKLNEFFSRSGQYFPLHERVRDVDQALKAGDDWLINQKETAADFLKGSPKKLYEYMDALTTQNGVEKDWGWIKKQFKLEDSDLPNLKRAESWLKEFQDDTHIPAFNYLRDQLPRLRGFNFNTEAVYRGRAKEAADMSFFHGAITDGSLNPKDAHLGRFINFLIREGFEKKFTGTPIKALQKLVDTQGSDGKYILGAARWPMQNYVNYVKGIPDVSQQVITRTFADFQRVLGEQAKKVNQFLPEGAKLPTEFNYPGAAFNRLLTLSYVGNLGLRPAIFVRDVMQAVTTTLPVLGLKNWTRGLVEGLTKQGLERAETAGALLSKRNIGELYGDIFNELPVGGNRLAKATELANKLMAPSRWGHNAARVIGYNGEYLNTLDAVKQLRAGVIDVGQFIKKTSAWFYDKPVVNDLLRMATDNSVLPEEVAHRSAMEVVDLTLWPYRRGAQPTLLRTGLGRVFGQYGMWPMNYLDFLRRMTTKVAEHPMQALGTIGMWGVANYTAVQLMEGIFHADVGKWFWVSPSGYGGSPHFELVQNIMKAPEETEEGRTARRRILEYPMNFFPTSNEIKSIITAVEDGGPMFTESGHLSDNAARVLGFKPLNEAHEAALDSLDLEDRARYELGYKRVK